MVEIRIIKKEGQVSILAKISYFLVGVLLTTTIFSITTQALGSYGIFAGLATCILLTYLGLRKNNNKKRLRIVTWGMVATTVFSLTLYGFFLFSVSKVDIG